MSRLLIIFLMLSVLSAGCGHKALGPAPVVPYCGFVNEGSPYAFCRHSDNSSERWRVVLNEAQNQRWVMTTTDGYSEMWAYGEKVKKYIEDLEKEIRDLKKKRK